jgi:hypothetical protein
MRQIVLPGHSDTIPREGLEFSETDRADGKVLIAGLTNPVLRTVCPSQLSHHTGRRHHLVFKRSMCHRWASELREVVSRPNCFRQGSKPPDLLSSLITWRTARTWSRTLAPCLYARRHLDADGEAR